MNECYNDLSTENCDAESKLKTIGEFILDAYHAVEKRAENPQKICGITTGYQSLDELTDGLHRGTLIFVGGRPSMGKSAFAINLALNAAREKASVALIAADMDTDQIAVRLLAIASCLEVNDLLRGNLSIDHWPRLPEAMNTLASFNIAIDDHSETLPDMQSLCRRLKRNKQGLDLIVVDDLQALTERMGFQPTARSITSITQALMQLAKELDTAVVVTTNLKPSLEARYDKRPVIADLYHGTIIEQAADVIMMLYRDEIYNLKPDNECVAEVIVIKQHDGELASIKLTFEGQYCRFIYLEPDWSEIYMDEPAPDASQQGADHQAELEEAKLKQHEASAQERTNDP